MTTNVPCCHKTSLVTAALQPPTRHDCRTNQTAVSYWKEGNRKEDRIQDQRLLEPVAVPRLFTPLVFHSLPQETVDAPSTNSFKTHL